MNDEPDIEERDHGQEAMDEQLLAEHAVHPDRFERVILRRTSKTYPCPCEPDSDCGYPACAHARQCERAFDERAKIRA